MTSQEILDKLRNEEEALRRAAAEMPRVDLDALSSQERRLVLRVRQVLEESEREATAARRAGERLVLIDREAEGPGRRPWASPANRQQRRAAVEKRLARHQRRLLRLQREWRQLVAESASAA